jgi:hypothetical protein
MVGTRSGEIILIANSEADTAARLIKHLGRRGFGSKGVESLGARIGVGLDKLAEAGYRPELAGGEVVFTDYNLIATNQE